METVCCYPRSQPQESDHEFHRSSSERPQHERRPSEGRCKIPLVSCHHLCSQSIWFQESFRQKQMNFEGLFKAIERHIIYCSKMKVLGSRFSLEIKKALRGAVIAGKAVSGMVFSGVH